MADYKDVEKKKKHAHQILGICSHRPYGCMSVMGCDYIVKVVSMI